jgi:uncharacterized protein (TIGR02145 family)
MKQTFKIKLLPFSLAGVFSLLREAVVFFLLLIGTMGFSHNIGINATGASADASALLDLSATNAGFLITRVDTTSIASLAFGLMTLAPSDSYLYMYSGTNWKSLGGVGTTSGSVTHTISGPVTTLDCGGAPVTGTLTDIAAASGVSVSVSYTGGNGGAYGGQAFSSIGGAGLTATLSIRSLATDAGSLIYTLAGSPSFAITVSGQSCTFTEPVVAIPPVFTGCIATGATVVVDVTSSTGAIWMDRNLGASQVATSSVDAAAYGCLYQWGRSADGHEDRGSAVTATNSATDNPGQSSFIIGANSPYDWRSPQNANLWQGVAGINNPCPTGYRVPTSAELELERTTDFISNNASGAFGGTLKLPVAGNRNSSSAALFNLVSNGRYWSSTVSGTLVNSLYFISSVAYILSNDRAHGFSVRCIKDNSTYR